jgi:hypothetical protein
MNPARQISGLASWQDLRDVLGGSFTARARGLLADEYVLQKDGASFGSLRLRGARAAEFVAGELAAAIEGTADGVYKVSGDLELTARPAASSADVLEVRAGGNLFVARVSFLRNTAVVSDGTGARAVRLAGNVTGRRYEVVFAGEEDATLPVAILLLYHLAALRRRVYRA